MTQIGLLGDKEATTQVINGTLHLDNALSMDEQEMLLAFEQTEAMRAEGQISFIVSKEKFQQYWSAMSKKTASSMLGLHFGHYKAAIDSNYIREVHSLMSTIALATGYSFNRWQHGLTVLLKKRDFVLSKNYMPFF